MVDPGSVLFGAGAFLSGSAALVSSVFNRRQIKATDQKVDHVAHQVTTSNGTTLAAIVEGTNDRRLQAIPEALRTPAESAHVAEIAGHPPIGQPDP